MTISSEMGSDFVGAGLDSTLGSGFGGGGITGAAGFGAIAFAFSAGGLVGRALATGAVTDAGAGAATAGATGLACGGTGLIGAASTGTRATGGCTGVKMVLAAGAGNGTVAFVSNLGCTAASSASAKLFNPPEAAGVGVEITGARGGSTGFG